MGIHDREYYREEERGFRLQRPRSVVVTLIIINVVIFIIDSFMRAQNHPISEFMAIKADLWQKPWLFYQLLTYGFAHAPASITIWHIVGNMFVLFFLGRAIEQLYGSAEFLRFYLSAILISGLVWLLSQVARGDMTTSAYGASGAVTAIVMLFIFKFPHQTLLIWGIVPIRAWIVGVMMIGIDILRPFTIDSQIAWEAHLGGAAFAAAYFYFKWNLSWIDFTWLQNWFTNVKQARKRKHLKIHRPPEENSKLLADADRVLAKISEEGEESLTKKERKILEKYSRMMRDKNT